MKQTLEAGIAKANITPPVGYAHQGYSGIRKGCVGVHDELFTKVLFLKNGKDKLVIITADLLGFPKEIVDDIKSMLKSKLGLNREDIIISASHTHYGPIIVKFIHDKDPDSSYLSQLKEKIVGAVYEASRNMHKATLSFGKGKANIGIINRRGKDSNSKEKNYPITPNPRGIIDDALNILKVDVSSQEEPLALLVNYTCHPVSFPGLAFEFSADYPGQMQYEIERFYTGKTMAMFANGACGDINPDITTPDKKRFISGTKEDTKRLGTLLALEALKLIYSTHKVEDVFFKKSIKTMKFSFNIVSKRELERIKRNLSKANRKMEAAKQRTLKLWIENNLEAIKNNTVLKYVEADLHYINISNELIIAGLPGEPLVEIGLNIKKIFKDKSVFIFGYTNGYIGYIPTAESLKTGCYEAIRSPRTWGYPGTFKEEVEKMIYDYFRGQN
ncbi:MAG: neutral/alkaline non-lysosomal ceramidase N-terminal domain-containing protein [Candidatus Heimdallarchaeaceae archaeon]